MGPVTLSFTSALVQFLEPAAAPEPPDPLPVVELAAPEVVPALELAAPEVVPALELAAPEVVPALELAAAVVPDATGAGAEDAEPAAEDEPVPDPSQAVSARLAVSVTAAAAIRRDVVRMCVSPQGQGFPAGPYRSCS
ncbi:hypothetical protein ACIRRH_38840 [Kitasatospora sp. NPDC101235]|uniref:hypothetical protein n=1 Tax=Kitasatospora sp. NPDC101235 TaxID=3364101 RepID=UPI0038241A51